MAAPERAVSRGDIQPDRATLRRGRHGKPPICLLSRSVIGDLR
jgi:hypothetical protein